MNEVIYNPLHFIGKTLLQTHNILYNAYNYDPYTFGVQPRGNDVTIIYFTVSLEGIIQEIMNADLPGRPGEERTTEHLQYTLYVSTGKKIYFQYFYDDVDFIKESLEDFNLEYRDNRILTYE